MTIDNLGTGFIPRSSPGNNPRAYYVMLGPRRVGKTVMIKQLVAEAISSGVDPCTILYVSIDTPIYSGKSLENFLGLMQKNVHGQQRIVIFDEIQYLRNWEVHLKDLVD